MLLTTTVGSFPKPEYLKKARAQFDRGEISREALKQLEQQATRSVIKMQEDIGLDILVDGEMYRGDMATYFAENLEGTAISGLVRSYGNRYYRKPVVTGQLVRPKPITLEWYRFAQSLTERPVKGMLTGPYTMMDWSFHEYYGSREEVAMAFAEVIAQEALDLQEAGAKYIQIDEPAVSTKPEEMRLAIKALGYITGKLKAKTVTHICYGEFERVFDELLQLPVNQIDLEFANSNYDLLDLFKKKKTDKEIAVGVLDVHSHAIEGKDLIKERIKKALTVFTPEKMLVKPDCGLKTRTQEEAYQKLNNMVEAVREVRQELKLTGSRG